jgi:uncharacterized protein YndB with AHSA1/START domain
MSGRTARQRVGDEAIRAKTGKTWREWIALLDAAGARAMSHREIAALLGARFGAERAWWWQTITVGYEQARGRRRTHERPDGFEISGTRTIAASATAAYRAFADRRVLDRWLPDAKLTITSAKPPRSIRFAWGAGTRGDVAFLPVGPGKTRVTVQHRRLATAAAAARFKGYWRRGLDRLERTLRA